MKNNPVTDTFLKVSQSISARFLQTATARISASIGLGIIVFLGILTRVWYLRSNAFHIRTTNSNQNVLGIHNQTSTPHPSRASLQKTYDYWLTIIRNHPDYRDGFVQLAWIAYQLGRVEESEQYRQKVHELDPNFTFPTPRDAPKQSK